MRFQSSSGVSQCSVDWRCRVHTGFSAQRSSLYRRYFNKNHNFILNTKDTYAALFPFSWYVPVLDTIHVSIFPKMDALKEVWIGIS